ncbi:hypothetical protein ADJ70_04595 [Olsenella sp. oral taxon 807]|nr:hypothetical protein ADJ70_04595 [Olsenella sp. oral taxon 807]
MGNATLMGELGAAWHGCEGDDGTVIHVAIDGRYAGHVPISDEARGTRRVAGELGLDEYHSELLPADKVEHVERAEGRSLAFVGDGINDAPVLARADVGIAMGAMGSDAAIEAADVVLMDDMPSKVAASVRIARRTLGIARQNIAFAIAAKVAVLLAGVGLAPMWLAVFGDVGVMAPCVLNAARALR